VQSEKMPVKHGLLVSLDFEDLLVNQLQIPLDKALHIHRVLWRMGFRYPRDFFKATIYNAALTACQQDKKLSNNLINLVRSADNA
jgi:hypothetical protein